MRFFFLTDEIKVVVMYLFISLLDLSAPHDSWPINYFSMFFVLSCYITYSGNHGQTK
jgi:hypothetical protein